MSISIAKNTDSSIKLRVYDDYITKNPIDLTQYIDFICAVTEDGNLLLEKKYSKNNMLTSTDLASGIFYILEILINKKDTQNMSINPSTEEKMRTLELFAINTSKQVTRLLVTNFYLEGSGYYVY